jgi:glucose/arabinose dehydrogenase
VVAAVVVLLLGISAGAAYAWQRGWLTQEFRAASRSCGELEATAPTVRGDADLDLRPVSPAASPTAMAFVPSGRRAYVAEREGTVRVLVDDQLSAEPVLDLGDRVGTGDDQGLLGLAVAPRGDWLYAWYPDPDSVGHLVAWPLRDGRPVVTEEEALLEVPYDTVHHNGGGLAVGPDGELYVGVGDGGLTGDPDGNAQDPDDRKGKLLRVDPDNADVEVVALGLRNPYRVAFDPVTEHLWLSDVGHECMEEVDLLPLGATGVNFGWNRFEGTRDFLGGDAGGFEPPLYAYPHDDEACAVIGGAVPRGPDAPAALRGRYVFGDFCSGRLSAVGADGREVLDLGLTVGGGLLGISASPRGALYVLSISEGIQRIV